MNRILTAGRNTSHRFGEKVMEASNGLFGAVSAVCLPEPGELQIDHLDRTPEDGVALLTFTWSPAPGHDVSPARG